MGGGQDVRRAEAHALHGRGCSCADLLYMPPAILATAMRQPRPVHRLALGQGLIAHCFSYPHSCQAAMIPFFIQLHAHCPSPRACTNMQAAAAAAAAMQQHGISWFTAAMAWH